MPIAPFCFESGTKWTCPFIHNANKVLLPFTRIPLAGCDEFITTFIFLRQDESLDSPCLARSAKADAIMPFIP